MAHVNIEFKAKGDNIEALEQKLLTLNPTFIGTDYQKDTYYNLSNGRLKLREGNIENALIWYDRQNVGGSKLSNILLYKHIPDINLKTILQTVHGIKVIVQKIRKIYFVDNVKFHFDSVEGLGTFLEVEAIDNDGTIGKEKLQQQCNYYINFFDIKKDDFLHQSYSDMLLTL